jgi:hypothetical protein
MTLIRKGGRGPTVGVSTRSAHLECVPIRLTYENLPITVGPVCGQPLRATAAARAQSPRC